MAEAGGMYVYVIKNPTIGSPQIWFQGTSFFVDLTLYWRRHLESK